jgi:hypothetical protein
MVLGVLDLFMANITILNPLGVDGASSGSVVDHVLTGLLADSGSVGFNSILKFLTYAKEGSQASAAITKATAARTPAAFMTPNGRGWSIRMAPRPASGQASCCRC